MFLSFPLILKVFPKIVPVHCTPIQSRQIKEGNFLTAHLDQTLKIQAPDDDEGYSAKVKFYSPCLPAFLLSPPLPQSLSNKLSLT